SDDIFVIDNGTVGAWITDDKGKVTSWKSIRQVNGVHTRLVARGEASPLKRFFSYFLSLQEIGAPRVSGEKKIPLRSPLELKRKAAPSSFCGAFYINSPFSHNFRCIFCCNQYSFMI
ncbi:MAG: hypothetical protein IKA51_02055, partial [Clostridia bacterium]|nr:hypothetical protein [Clostridia bacterium]